MDRYKKVDNIGPDSKYITRIKLILFSYGLHAILVYRLGKFLDYYLCLKKESLINYIFLTPYYLLNFLIRILYGINIKKKAEIGIGFYIGHFGNIFIGNCAIGDNCSVNQQVQVGNKQTDKAESKIVIGNNVWIGAHSKISEAINVGNGATISGGSFVTNDVKENALVMGRPSRMISKNYDNSSLL